MTKEFHALVRLAMAGSIGYSLNDIPLDIDWARLEKLAIEQGVQPLVGYALRLSPSVACPDDTRRRMISEMRQTAFSNSAWKEATLHLVADMRSSGIPTLLVKGYAVSSCYAAPDCRVSGDADLLIPEEYEKKAYSYMESKGFHVEPRWRHGHHAVCTHPALGCVELHVQLYDEIVEDIWFKKIDEHEFLVEKPITEDLGGIEFHTLAPTDHLLFLALHLVKHFIMTGMSLRMLIDVVLFFEKNVNRIDTARFWNIIDRLGFRTLVQNLMYSVIQHGNVEFVTARNLDDKCCQHTALILDDLEKGGWLGNNGKKARSDGWYEYNRQIITKQSGRLRYYLYMVCWKFARYVYVLFPTQMQLAKYCPYIEKKSWLVPWAWIRYVIYRLKRAASRGSFTSEIVNSEQSISAIGAERIEIFRKLDML